MGGAGHKRGKKMNGWGWGWGRGGGERWRGGGGSSASRQRHTADSRNKTTTSSKWKTSVCTTGLRVTSNAQRPLFRHRALVDTHAASIGESCPQRAIRTSGKTSALPPPRIPQPVPKAGRSHQQPWSLQEGQQVLSQRRAPMCSTARCCSVPRTPRGGEVCLGILSESMERVRAVVQAPSRWARWRRLPRMVCAGDASRRWHRQTPNGP